MSVRSLTDAQMRATADRIERVARAVVRLARLHGVDSDAFVEQAVDVVLAGQAEQAGATWEYLAAVVAEKDPAGVELDVEPPVDVLIGAATHDGTPLETVYRRPARLWAELVETGVDVLEVADRVYGELALTAGADVAVTGRMAETAYDAVDRRVDGWKRVPNVAACKWCRYIATQKYRRPDLAPAHRGCLCGVEPLTHRVTGRVVDPEALRKIKAEGVPKRYGAKSRPRVTPPPKVVEPYRPLDLDELARLVADEPLPTLPVGPARNTRSGADALRYASPKAERTFAPVVDELDKLHGLADDAFSETVVVAGGKADYKGGHFSPAKREAKPRRPGRGSTVEERDAYRARYATWINSRGRPEIRVNDRGDGTGIVSFVHEYGHRLDWIVDPNVRGGGRFVSESLSAEGPEVRAAFERFFLAARDEHFETSRRSYSNAAYRSYFSDVREVWARAYSQWATDRIGGAARESLDAMLSKNLAYQWPDDVFRETIGPAVEEVLRARGLMT